MLSFMPTLSLPAPELGRSVITSTPTPAPSFSGNYGGDMGKLDLGNAASGAVSGAASGASVGGPIGGVIGGVLGGLANAWSDKPAGASGGGGGGLASAFTQGLGSLGIPGSGGGFFGGTTTQEVTQVQSVDQTNSINVQNILGRPFGEFNSEDQTFNPVTLISDVFRIKDAQDQQAASAAGPVSRGAQIVSSGAKIDPIMLIAGAALVLFAVLMSKKN